MLNRPSKAAIRPFGLIIALMAALAVGLWLLLPGGLLQAQDATIPYAENDTTPVATFTGSDPEGRPVYWSLATEDVSEVEGINAADENDHAEFSISADGVLSFKFSPDYEMPRGVALDANTNTYRVVVVAADEPLGATNRELGYEKVTVNVTDADEPGVITLDAQQPQENRPLLATLIDDDATVAQKTTAANWKWEHSEAKRGPWTAILTATSATYTPLGVADKYLRATATYTDGHGSDKNAQVVSAHMVRAVPAANNANPVFPDENTTTENTIEVGRKVDENSPPGTRVGDPVAANDAPGDVLTYTLTEVGENDNYRIDPATGQITVGPRTALDFETNPSETVSVTATDPTGGATTPAQDVTITINDVNEDPVITAGDTKASVVENTAIATAVSTYTADPEVTGTACDNNDNPCTWSLKGADAGDFEISNEDSDRGALTFKTVPNYEAPADANGDNVYMVTVVVTDAGIDGKGKLSAERDVVVAVTNEDEGTRETVVTLSSLAPKVGVPLTATLSDPDGGEKDVEWQWSIEGATDTTARPNGNISDAESATYTPKANDVGGKLTATVEYADALGSGRTGTQEAVDAVVADLAAKAPVFKPKPASRSVPENYATGEMYGTTPNNYDYPNVGAPVTATDPNDDIRTYSLGGADMGSFSIDQMTGQITVKTATKLNLEAKATYMVTVTATDPGDLSDSVDVTIKLTGVDEGPEIAGDDIIRDYPENGTGSVATLRATDPERRPVHWSLLAIDANETPTDITPANDSADVGEFSISANGVLSFNFPPDYENPRGRVLDADSNTNTYKVVVLAADEPLGADNRRLGYKKVTVNVTNVEETETVTLSLRQAQVGTAVTATYNDSDAEKPAGTDLMWKWYLGGSEISEGIAATGSTSSFIPISGGNHKAEASYTKADGSKKAASSATIYVRATPDATNVLPLFPSVPVRRSVDENSPPSTMVGAAVTATDPGDTLTYTLTDETGLFDIDPANGRITVAPRATLDADTTPSYTVMVTATDPAGGPSTPKDVTITINDVNEDPVITAGDTKASVVENTAIATAVSTYTADPEVTGTACDNNDNPCTWSLKGADAGDFEISNEDSDRGALTFKTVPNYEAPADANGDNVYMVTVVVTDAGIDGKGKLSAERDVVVTVTNINEPVAADAADNPVVTLSSLQPKVGVPLTATLSDPDGGEKDIEWQWSITGAETSEVPGMPTASDGEIDGAESATYTPKVNDVTGILTATVMYADAVGSGRTGTGLAANPVVQDLSAQAPVFKPKPTSRSVPENYATDEIYGTPNPVTYPIVHGVVTATDPNGDTLTYSLGGADMGSFSIDQGTGQITVKTARKLDFESKATYMVTVTATDPGGLSDSVDVTIKLTDEDEGPVIIRGGLAISGPNSPRYAENGTDAVGTYKVSGPDAESASWTLRGDDAGDFRFNSSSGVLTFISSPNFEVPRDANTDNVYTVMLRATDGKYTDIHAITITVTNEDDAGAVSLSMSTPRVGTEITASLSDPDGTTTNVRWQWAREDAVAGTYANIGGATSAAYTPERDDEGNRLRATASYTDPQGSGKTANLSSTNPVRGSGSILADYDGDQSGRIDVSEALDAVDDYFDRTLSKTELLRIILAHFSQTPVV